MSRPRPASYARLSRRDVIGATIGFSTIGLGLVAASTPVRGALARALRPSPALEALTLSGPWLNGAALRPQTLRGKVVVVAFWTYSCINSLRVLPYLRAWQARYGDKLVVIGVHTPEFAFEKDLANVRTATQQLGVTFPVVLDSDYRIWRAFGNNAWPAFYFIGSDGRVRGRAIGEGAYDQSERLIQRLLSDAQATVPPGLSTVAGEGPEAAPDLADLETGETYVGYRQTSGFASPGGLRRDLLHAYEAPRRLALNRWALKGGWTAGEEFATAAEPGGALAFRFHARDLHMVLAPATSGPVRFKVRLDGAPPSVDHGWDTAPDGSGVVREPRMYQLVRQTQPVDDRTFELQFLDPGARAYVFTFG